jgi:spore coat protein CotF
MTDALNENPKLQASQKQLLQEAKTRKKKVSKLTNLTRWEKPDLH